MIRLRLVAIMLITGCFINAQVSTFTLIGGVPSTTLTAPLNNGASMTFTSLGIPANYKVKMTGYYLTPGYVPGNVLMFDSTHASTNNAGHVIINTTATSCTMALTSSFYMSKMDWWHMMPQIDHNGAGTFLTISQHQ